MWGGVVGCGGGLWGVGVVGWGGCGVGGLWGGGVVGCGGLCTYAVLFPGNIFRGANQCFEK